MSQGVSPPLGAEPPPREPAARPGDARPQATRDGTAVIIDQGARFEGVLTCPRAARIEGEFKGELTALGRVELSETSRVEGRVDARDIVVAGQFEGELLASHSVELRETARVVGDITARELSAREGCTVTGRCRTVTSEAPPQAGAKTG